MRKGHGRRHGPQETHSRGYIGTAVLSTPQDILAWGGTTVQETRTERARIVPMIAYENGAAAIDWLVRAFGFRDSIESPNRMGRSVTRNSGSKVVGSSSPLRPRTTKVRSTTARPVPRPNGGQRSHG